MYHEYNLYGIDDSAYAEKAK